MELHLNVPFIGTIGTFTAVLLALNWHFSIIAISAGLRESRSASW
jgi:hypothetical protein